MLFSRDTQQALAYGGMFSTTLLLWCLNSHTVPSPHWRLGLATAGMFVMGFSFYTINFDTTPPRDQLQ